MEIITKSRKYFYRSPQIIYIHINYVPPPQSEIPFEKGRREIVLEKISNITHGFVATDLQHLCSQVLMKSVSKITFSIVNL